MPHLKSNRKPAILILIVVTATLAVVLLVHFRTSDESLTVAARNSVITVGGVVAAIFAAWRFMVADRQANIADRGQITDRFSKAIEHLGAVHLDNSPNVELRLGGIRALVQIAEDSEPDYWPILHIFAAYLRHHRSQRRLAALAQARASSKPSDSHTGTEQVDSRQPRTILPPDVQAVMAAFRILLTTGKRSEELDLSECVIPTADLEGVCLDGSILENTNLHRSNLNGASLKNIKGREISLSSCWLNDAHLDEANLFGAMLIGCDLVGAFMRGADLRNANLASADLTDADISGAKLCGANLSAAVVTQDQLETAKGDHLTKLSSWLNQPIHWE